MWIIALLLISVACLLVAIALLWRNHAVYNYRMTSLDEESAFVREDIMRRFKGSHLRHDALPSYDHMVLTFWRPLRFWHRPLRDFYDS